MTTRDTHDPIAEHLADPAFWRETRPCPDMPLAWLRRYSALEMDEDEQATIEAHLATCAVCRDTVDLLDDEMLANEALTAPANPADHGPGPAPLPIAEVTAPTPPRGRRWTAIAAAFVAAAALTVLIPRLTADDPPWTAELAAARLDPAAGLNPLREHIGARDRDQAATFSGAQRPAPHPAFTRAFAAASARLNAADHHQRNRWQEVADRLRAEATEADAWGRWAALVAFTATPPPTAVTPEQRNAFADWAAPRIGERLTCRRDLLDVREGKPGAVARVVECLLTTGDRVRE